MKLWSTVFLRALPIRLSARAPAELDSFFATDRLLPGDQSSFALRVLVGAGCLLAAWLTWALSAKVSLYEVSADARVELEGATFPLDAFVVGRVVANDLKVGRRIARGEVLVELDSVPEQLRRREAQVTMQGLGPQIAKLESQIDAEQNMQRAEEESAKSATVEARNRIHEAEIAGQYAQRDLARIDKLNAQRIVSTRELEKAQSDAERQQVTVAALQAAAARVAQDQTARNRERDVRIERLLGEITALTAQGDTLAAEVARLENEIDRHRIRAPIDGLIGEAAQIRVGAMLGAGDRLGSIIPSGRLHIAALYPTHAALGRIHRGQPVTLRLDGFPWAEYGAVSGVVSAVAQEARDGKVRVEAELVSPASFHATLEHGMPGTLEITVERVTPWDLTMRCAGRWLTQPI